MKAPPATAVVRLVTSPLIALNASACTMALAIMAIMLEDAAFEEASAAEEDALEVQEGDLGAETPTNTLPALEQV